MADTASFLSKFNPEGKQGKLLLLLNAAGMVFAAASNTFAVASDKNTKPEDKKILVPAGVATGIANIVTYYAVTTKIIKNFENSAVKKFGEIVNENGKDVFHSGTMSEAEITKNARASAIRQIEKAQKKPHFFKKDEAKQVLNDMVDTFFVSKEDCDVKQLVNNNKGKLSDALKDAEITPYAKTSYIKEGKAAASVMGAFGGAIIGAAILTPIIRDISAYFVQKNMEKKNPELTTKPYRPYFDPAHTKVENVSQPRVKQPLTFKNYSAFTSSSLKI